MSEALNELGAHIEAKRTDCVLSWEVAHGELTLQVTPSSFVSFVDFLKTDRNCKFSTLVDITAVDYPERDVRFDVVYHFLSMYQNHRIRLKVGAREEDPGDQGGRGEAVPPARSGDVDTEIHGD